MLLKTGETKCDTSSFTFSKYHWCTFIPPPPLISLIISIHRDKLTLCSLKIFWIWLKGIYRCIFIKLFILGSLPMNYYKTFSLNINKKCENQLYLI